MKVDGCWGVRFCRLGRVAVGLESNDVRLFERYDF